MIQWVDQSALAALSGVVIPAYFSDKPSDETVRHLLWMTLADCHHYTPLERVWLVVDGDLRTAHIAHSLRDALWREHGYTFQLLSLPENGGKLWAMQMGARALVDASPDVQYMVVRDGDGDHAAADLPALLRAATQLAESYGSTHLIVTGARRSRHHPMGWLRGEMETLLDQVTLDALSYYLAREGRVLNLRHVASPLPDLSSGFKVYGRQMLEALFVRNTPQLVSLSESDYWHYGPETCTIVEAMLGGCVLGEVLRLTWDGQPTTSFGEFKQLSLYGELLAWVIARLAIPLQVAAQFYDNHTPHMLLRTTAEGRESLEHLRAYALNRAGEYAGVEAGVPPPVASLPFV